MGLKVGLISASNTVSNTNKCTPIYSISKNCSFSVIDCIKIDLAMVALFFQYVILFSQTGQGRWLPT